MFCIHCYWYSTVFWYSLNHLIYCSSLSRYCHVFPHRPHCFLFRCTKSCTVVVVAVTGHSVCTLPKRQMKLYADAGRNMCMCVCLHKPVCLFVCMWMCIGVYLLFCWFDCHCRRTCPLFSRFLISHWLLLLLLALGYGYGESTLSWLSCESFRSLRICNNKCKKIPHVCTDYVFSSDPDLSIAHSLGCHISWISVSFIS